MTPPNNNHNVALTSMTIRKANNPTGKYDAEIQIRNAFCVSPFIGFSKTKKLVATTYIQGFSIKYRNLNHTQIHTKKKESTEISFRIETKVEKQSQYSYFF